MGLSWGPRVKGGGAVGLGTHGVSVWAGALGGPGFKVGSTVTRGCALGVGGGLSLHPWASQRCVRGRLWLRWKE